MAEDIIGGKTFKQWDELWKPIGFWGKDNIGRLDKNNKGNIEKLKGRIGLYKIIRDDNKEVIYIGKATERGKGKGLYKRLNDYIRKEGGGRKSEGPGSLYDHINNKKNVTVEFLDVGFHAETKEAEIVVATTCYLEIMFINKDKNKHPEKNSHSKIKEDAFFETEEIESTRDKH